MTRLLFIEESWQGSCARSMRENLAAQPGIEVVDLAEDRFLPAYRYLSTRLVQRLFRPLYLRELHRAVLEAVAASRPDALVAYKGSFLGADLLRAVQDQGIPALNVYPDYSPHAYGRRHAQAMGAYDLVISTKPFHPPLWASVYGYSNPCVCVPHGYDPAIHLWTEPPVDASVDLALCASWRPEYHRLMAGLAEALRGEAISVAVAGSGWEAQRGQFPAHWRLTGPRTGRAYGDFLRGARIALAPVNREVVIGGVRQPGDEDTTRTYELAAAYCFFLHQRTDFVATVFDEASEVPLWRDAGELAELVRRWLPDPEGRRRLAAAAHARAVPAYSLPQRSAAVLREIEGCIARHKQAGRTN